MFLSFFLIINTSSFQDYVRENIISYVNSNTDNTIEISDSRYNLKGELIISDILLSDINSDTIFKLESLSTKYIPVISNNQYYSSLKIQGLKLYIDQSRKNTDQNTSIRDLNQVFENREDDIKDIIRKSGYTAVTKAGKEKILFTPFYEALLLAKGVKIL